MKPRRLPSGTLKALIVALDGCRVWAFPKDFRHRLRIVAARIQSRIQIQPGLPGNPRNRA